MEKEYNKLVRDKIPEIIEGKGEKVVTHTAEEEEYEKALMTKLSEEVDEFKDNPSEEEIADILEVIEAICKLKDFNKLKIEEIKQKKLGERGGFNKKIILDKTE